MCLCVCLCLCMNINYFTTQKHVFRLYLYYDLVVENQLYFYFVKIFLSSLMSTKILYQELKLRVLGAQTFFNQYYVSAQIIHFYCDALTVATQFDIVKFLSFSSNLNTTKKKFSFRKQFLFIKNSHLRIPHFCAIVSIKFNSSPKL